MQRNGTTSVGQFFKIHGFKVANWYRSQANKWAYHWLNGDFEAIFNSNDFKSFQVFEDDPWWFPEFYKILYHRFPKAKFILFTRDEEKWFESMMNHSSGKSLGNTRLHCKIYRREDDFFDLKEKSGWQEYDDLKIDNLLTLKEAEEYYKSTYNRHNREVKEFFLKNAPESLFVTALEDPMKWQKLGEFMGMSIDKDFEIHVNKSKT